MEEDMHLCLVCQTTISGLMNYIDHKKNGCSGKREMKRELQQPVQSGNSGVTDIARNNVQCLTQKYPDTHQYSTDFSSYSGAGSSHAGIIDFTTGQFTGHVDEDNKGAVLDNVLYTSHDIKSGTLFDHQVTNIVITSSSTNLDIPEAPALNLSPSIFRPAELTSLTSGTPTGGLHEDHGLLAGCIDSEQPDTGYPDSIPYPVLSPDTGQPRIITDIIGHNTHKDEDHQTRHASEKVDDFFESLELMSKNDPRAEKGQSLGNLPISNILSNLTFSSDEEEFSFDFADDVSFDSLSDESDAEMTSRQTSQAHSSSRNRPRFRGKWPPGQAPTVSSQKVVKGGKKFPPDTFKKANKSNDKLKPITAFTCSICDVSFSCRYKYSNHFNSTEHKQSLLKRRSNKAEGRPFKHGKGKSFKLIREVNKQFENDPFIQSFTDNKTEDPEQTKEADVRESSVENDLDKHDNKDSDTAPSVDSETKACHSEEDRDEQSTKTEVNPDDADQTDNGDNVEFDDADRGENGAAEQSDIDTNSQNTTEDKASTNDEPMYTAMPTHICTICDRKYPNKYYLASHLITNLHRKRGLAQPEEAFSLLQRYQKYIIRLSPYQCSMCRYYFNKYEEFVKHLESKQHIVATDNLVAEMLCSLCGFKTHYNEDLLQHFSTEDHKRRIKKMNKICIIKESHVKCKCKYCGLVMNSYSRLQYHVKVKHADKEYVPAVKRQIGVRNRPNCSVCGRQFASKSTLELHFRRRHMKEKPYNCEACKKVFTDKYAFKMHGKTSRHIKNVLQSKARAQGSDENAPENDMENRSTGAEDSEPMLDSSTGMLLTKSERAVETDDVKDNSLTEETYAILAIKEDKDEILSEKKGDSDWMPRIKALLPVGAKQNIEKKKRVRKPRNLSGVKEKTYKCNHCSFTVTSYNDLRPHYLEEHAAQTIICELCDIVFLSDKAMKLHILSKEHQTNINRSSGIEEKPDVQYFECHICKKKFTDEKYCKFHTAYQHFHCTSEEALIKEIGDTSITRERFRQVLEESEPRPFTARIECPECKVTFKKPNFIEHLRIHTGEKPFKCKICPKAFMASVTLRKHLLGHFGCLERTCEICGKHFKKVDSYVEHMKIHEVQKVSSVKNHVCDTCGLAFYLEKQLRSHMRRHKKKEFKCTYPGCHWKFLFSNELKYHMQTHTQLKPFLCDTCGYAAATKCRLVRHRKTHTGERNFHCEYCPYKAGNKTHLHRHMRIHIGSKPFKCPYCEYTCNTHENMRKHIVQTKKHEGLKIYPCKFCDYGTNSCADFRNHLMEKHEDELDPDIKLMSGLSAFTGLYNKALDPAQPEEGNKIHQLKERIPRAARKRKPSVYDLAGSDGEKKGTKGSRKAKLPEQVTEIIVEHIMDVSNFPTQEELKGSGERRSEEKLYDVKVRKDVNIVAMTDKSNVVYVNSIQDRPNTKVEHVASAESLNTQPNNSTETIEIIPCNYYEEPAGLNLTFGQDYPSRLPETVPKPVIVNMHTPVNYRSLLKGSNNVNLPIYQTYNTYSDQQLLSNSSHGFQQSFSANVFPVREESVRTQMMPDTMKYEYEVGAYVQAQTQGRSNTEGKTQAGNLVIDLGFPKKNC